MTDSATSVPSPGDASPQDAVPSASDERRLLIRRLKEARERKGWSLEDLSDRTRISLHVLTGIESGNFDVVEPPYLRAFLRMYAKHVDVPVDEVHAVFPEPKTPVAVIEESEEERVPIPIVRRSNVPWATIFKGLVVVGLLGGLWWWQPWSRRESTSRPAANVVAPKLDTVLSFDQGDSLQRAAADSLRRADSLAASRPSGSPILRPLPPPPPQAGTQAPPPLIYRATLAERMAIRATDTVWVQIIRGDSTVIFDAIMPPGYQREWQIRDSLRVTIGRYWAAELLLNDRTVDVPRRGTRHSTTFLCTPEGVVLR